MTGPGRRPTSHDVAAAAGVSRATVGFVLNDTPSQTISDATRRAVLDAAERLGYVPSAAARVLRSGRSHLVLCLVPPWATTEGLARFVLRIAEELATRGFVTVSHVTSAAPLAELLGAATPAAVVSLAPLHPDDEARLRLLGVPHVPAYIVDYPGRPHSMSLTQQAMGAAQASHLLAHGYRRLVYLQPADVGFAARADGRHEGAASAVATAGPPAGLERLAYADERELRALVRRLRDEPGDVGVCAFDDLAAFEILAALGAEGVGVPHPVGVIGVDDIAAAAFAHPPLTSVRLDLEEQARELAQRVQHTVDPSVPAPRVTAAGHVHVTVRASC